MTDSPLAIDVQDPAALGRAAPFKSILVAIDGSYSGTRAMQLGTQLAAMCDARLAVLYVVDTIRGWAPQFAWGPRTYEDEHLDHGHRMLQVLTEDLPGHEKIQKVLRAGDPPTEIARAANECAADLLILGGPSHHRLRHVLHGTVDEMALDHAKCAILVLGPDRDVMKAP